MCMRKLAYDVVGWEGMRHNNRPAGCGGGGGVHH